MLINMIAIIVCSVSSIIAFSDKMKVWGVVLATLAILNTMLLGLKLFN